MADFKTQIEDIAGLIPSAVDAEQFLKDGIWDIIKRIEKIAPQMLPLFSASSTWSDANGVTLINESVTSVTRDSINCIRVSEQLIARVTDATSLYLASEFDPVYYILNGTLYIKPDPDVSNAGAANIVQAGAITNWNSGTSSIASFPDSLYRLVILFAALRVLNERVCDYSLSILGDLAIEPSTPTFESVEEALPTIDAITMDTFPTFTGASSDIDFSSVVDPPVFVSPILQLTSSPEITDLDLSRVSIPISPGVSNVEVDDSSWDVPTYTKPVLSLVSLSDIPDLSISTNIPILPTLSSVEVDITGLTQPVYVAPTATISTFPTISDLTISATLPTVPVVLASEFDTSGLTLPTYTKPRIDTLAEFPTVPVLVVANSTPTAPTSSATSIDEDDWDIPVYTSPVFSPVQYASTTPLSISSIAPIAPIMSSISIDTTDWDAPVYTSPVFSPVEYPTITALSISSTAPIAPIMSSISIDITDWDAPIYASPVFSPIAYPTITALSISSTAPTAPIVDAISIDTSDWNAPSYVLPIVSILTFPTISDLDVSSVFSSSTFVAESQFDNSGLTVPTYTKPTISNKVSMPSIAPSPTAPTVPTAPTLASTIIDTSGWSTPEYVAPVLSLTSIPASFSSTLALSPIIPTPISEYNFVSPIVGEIVTSFTATPPVFDDTNTALYLDTDMDGILGDEDIELAMATAKQVELAIQHALAEFNEDNVVYQAQLSIAVKDADLALQTALKNADADSKREIQDFSAKLQKYQTDIQGYIAEVNAEVQEYQLSSQHAQYLLQRYSEENKLNINRYSGDIQNALNLFNKQNVEYQAQIQEAFENAKYEETDDSLEIQKYQAEIQSYQTQINSDIQLYTSTVNSQLQPFVEGNRVAIAEYSADIQNELNEFNKELVAYEAAIKYGISNSQLSSAEQSQKIQLLQVELEEYKTKVNTELQEYTANLQKDIQSYSEESKVILAKYSTDIQNAQIDFNSESVVYQAELQRRIKDAEFESVEDKDNIQLYSANIALYQQSVNIEIQEFVNNLNKDIQGFVEQNRVLLEEYTINIQTKLHEFNAENSVYQAELQRRVKNAEFESVEDKDNLQLYSSNIVLYQQSVNTKVQEFTSNLNNSIQEFTEQNRVLLEEYTITIQTRLHEFNADNSVYQAELQRRIKNAEFESIEDKDNLQLYNANIALYQQSINAEVQEFVSNLNSSMQGFTEQNRVLLEEYTINIQTKLHEFNASNAVYQTELQKKVQNAQLTDASQAREIEIYRSEIQSYQMLVNANVSEYQANLQKDLQSYAEQNKIKLAQYTSDIQNEMNGFNKELSIYQGVIQYEIVNSQLSSSEQNQKVQLLQIEISRYREYVGEQVQQFTANTQKEIQGYVEESKSILSKFTADLQSSQLDFNALNEVYKAELQRRIKDAELESTEDIQAIQLYSASISLYQHEVNSKIQEFVSNLQKNLQVYSEQNKIELSEYGSSIQNELNKFNKEATVYQAELQRRMKDAELSNSKVSQELQQYQLELGSYSSEINSSVQQYTINEIQKQMSIWSKQIDADLTEYNSDIQIESTRVANLLNRYSKEIDKVLATYQAENANDIQIYVSESQGIISEFDALLKQAIAKFTKELESYRLDSARVSARNMEELNIYQIQSTVYSANLGQVMQKYSADLQRDGVALQLLESSYNKIKNEYEQGFVPFQIKKEN